MPASSTLLRWLPTLLGIAIAGLIAIAYETDLIGADPSSDATSEPISEATREQAPASREAASFVPRSRPESPREAPPLELEDRAAWLEAQNRVLAERVVTGELSYYGHGPAELEAMARHCDVRIDYPTRLDPEAVADLGLDGDEQTRYARALQRFADDEAELYRALYRELAPQGDAERELVEIRKDLVRLAPRTRTPGDEAIQRDVAEERAGLREVPDAAELSPYSRYMRARFDAGERFATVLAAELGAERSEELRRALGGWPGARTRQWGCPDEGTKGASP